VNVLELADRVRVVRGRAEDHGDRYRTCVARAVAPMTRLAPWCFPLVQSGGQLLAMKGESAQTEVDEAAAALSGVDVDIVTCGDADLETATTVVRVTVPR
jgi:16S rRNA (guanine527-N7)-methyltransferase